MFGLDAGVFGLDVGVFGLYAGVFGLPPLFPVFGLGREPLPPPLCEPVPMLPLPALPGLAPPLFGKRPVLFKVPLLL